MQSRPHRGGASRPRLPFPVAAPVRESLRGLRDVLHVGRDLAQEVLDRSPLPPPVGEIARTVLSRVDRVAQHVEDVATDVARGLLGDDRPGRVGDQAEAHLARTVGVGLRQALLRLGAPHPGLDDEAVAAALAGLGAGLDIVDEAEGVEIAQALLRADGSAVVRRGAEADAEALPVAVFAVVLWLLSDRSRDRAGLDACVDLAAALAPDIRDAQEDGTALASLLREFRDHV